MAQRALMAMLPLLVGIGLLWAPPIVARLLPAYVPGLRSMRVLVVAALAMSTATLPSYYLLGLGRARAMLPAAGMAAAVAAAAIFTAAALDPRPVTVAWGAAAGYGAFALAMLALAIPRLAPTRSQRWGLLAATLLPTVWGRPCSWRSRAPRTCRSRRLWRAARGSPSRTRRSRSGSVVGSASSTRCGAGSRRAERPRFLPLIRCSG